MRLIKHGLSGVIAGFALLGAQGASALVLTAGNADCSAFVAVPSQPNVEAAFATGCGIGSATQLYKSDFERYSILGDDSGTYAASYITTFGGFEGLLDDPSSALILSLLSQPITGFDSLFLLAKDGRQNPSFYGWDITGWNGTEAISVTAWNGVAGAISNVSIWGARSVSVPEPGALSLLGLGLLGLGLARRKARA